MVASNISKFVAPQIFFRFCGPEKDDIDMRHMEIVMCLVVQLFSPDRLRFYEASLESS